jgi:sarcosine oxidase, subunit delta
MLQLNCPFCGPRDEPEFVCGGESYLVRAPLSASDAEWAEYLYFRKNPKGVILERWRHAYGCGKWFNVARNTVTHEVMSTRLMTDPPP